MRDRWIAVLAIAFFLVSAGGTATTIWKLGNIESGLTALSLSRSVPSSFPGKVDLNIQRAPMNVSAHVSFTGNGFSKTYTITAATSADVDAEVARTKTRLETEWGVTVTVTYLVN